MVLRPQRNANKSAAAATPPTIPEEPEAETLNQADFPNLAGEQRQHKAVIAEEGQSYRDKTRAKTKATQKATPPSITRPPNFDQQVRQQHQTDTDVESDDIIEETEETQRSPSYSDDSVASNETNETRTEGLREEVPDRELPTPKATNNSKRKNPQEPEQSESAFIILMNHDNQIKFSVNEICESILLEFDTIGVQLQEGSVRYLPDNPLGPYTICLPANAVELLGEDNTIELIHKQTIITFEIHKADSQGALLNPEKKRPRKEVTAHETLKITFKMPTRMLQYTEGAPQLDKELETIKNMINTAFPHMMGVQFTLGREGKFYTGCILAWVKFPIGQLPQTVPGCFDWSALKYIQTSVAGDKPIYGSVKRDIRSLWPNSIIAAFAPNALKTTKEIAQLVQLPTTEQEVLSTLSTRFELKNGKSAKK